MDSNLQSYPSPPSPLLIPSNLSSSPSNSDDITNGKNIKNEEIIQLSNLMHNVNEKFSQLSSSFSSLSSNLDKHIHSSGISESANKQNEPTNASKLRNLLTQRRFSLPMEMPLQPINESSVDDNICFSPKMKKMNPTQRVIQKFSQTPPPRRKHVRRVSCPIFSLDSLEVHKKSIYLENENRIKLNVGGQIFETTLTTLTKSRNSMLGAMFSGQFPLDKDTSGCYFIDRDPTYFRFILNFLRDGSISLSNIKNLEELLREAKFYQIQGLISYIETKQRRANETQRMERTMEKEYRLVPNISENEVNTVFNTMTVDEAYDFESWLPIVTRDKEKLIHMLFSKNLTRGELTLLDRLQADL